MSERSFVVATLAVSVLALVFPGASAGGPFSADLTLFGDVDLDGDIVWNGSEPVLDLRPGLTDTPTLAIEAAEATVHTWRWEVVAADVGPVRTQQEVNSDYSTETLTNVHLDGITADDEAHTTIAGVASVSDVTMGGLLLRAAESFHANVDPREGDGQAVEHAPYDIERVDTLVVRSTRTAANLAGDLEVGLWGLEGQLGSDQGGRDVRSGAWTELRSPILGAVEVQVNQVVWLELTAATVTVDWPGPSTLADAGPSIDLAGTLEANDGSGALAGGDQHLARALRDSVRLTGSVLVLPTISPDSESDGSNGDEVQPYDRVDVHITGTVTSALVAGTSVTGADASVGTPAKAAIGLGALLAFLAAYKYGPMLGAALFSRIEKSEVLNSPSRTGVWDVVRTNPGLFAGEIGERAQLSRSTTRYHLKVLADRGYVSVYQDGSTVRYYENHGKWLGYEHLVALLQHEKTKCLADAIAANPGCSQRELASKSGLSQSTVSFHLLKLNDAGAIRTERTGGKAMQTYHPTTKLSGVLSRLNAATAVPSGGTAPMEVTA